MVRSRDFYAANNKSPGSRETALAMVRSRYFYAANNKSPGPRMPHASRNVFGQCDPSQRVGCVHVPTAAEDAIWAKNNALRDVDKYKCVKILQLSWFAIEF